MQTAVKRRSAQVIVEPTTIRPGVRTAFIQGPDNVRIELLERTVIEVSEAAGRWARAARRTGCVRVARTRAWWVRTGLVDTRDRGVRCAGCTSVTSPRHSTTRESDRPGAPPSGW